MRTPRQDRAIKDIIKLVNEHKKHCKSDCTISLTSIYFMFHELGIELTDEEDSTLI